MSHYTRRQIQGWAPPRPIRLRFEQLEQRIALEVDTFLNSTAQLTVQLPGGGTAAVNLQGPTTVQVDIAPNGATTLTNSSGLDYVNTQMTQLDLAGSSPLGPVTVTLDPSQPTLGTITENANNTPGILDVPPFTATG